jgi:acyl-coenzyme A thioesterase PaaI-like protein
MSRLLDTLLEAKRTGDFRRFTDAIPYARFLGISAEVVDGELVGKLAYDDKLIGNASLPALHGGTLGALLESTAIFQVLFDAETVSLPKTITLTLDYLRSGRPVDTFAKGIVTRHGRRVVNVRVEAWQDDRTRPIATANVHFLIQPVGGAEKPEAG